MSRPGLTSGQDVHARLDEALIVASGPLTACQFPDPLRSTGINTPTTIYRNAGYREDVVVALSQDATGATRLAEVQG